MICEPRVLSGWLAIASLVVPTEPVKPSANALQKPGYIMSG